MFRIVFILSLVFVFTACDDDAESDSSSATDTDGVIDAAAIFADKCAGCHGATLTGGDSGPDLNGRLGKEDAELVNSIIHGDDEMPPQNVTDDEAQSLVDYIRKTLEK